MKFLPLLSTAGLSFALLLQPLSLWSSGQSSAIAKPNKPCSVKVVPEPCPGNCLLKLNGCELTQLKTIYLDVYDGLGKQVKREIRYPADSPRFYYSVDSNDPMAPGVYLVKVASTTNNDTRTIVQ